MITEFTRYSVWILVSRGRERFVNEIHRHDSDIVNYSSPLRAKECNLNDVCFESSKTAVVNHGQGSQDSKNVKTKVEPSSMHRETVASSIRVAPASTKCSSGSSGGRSNPASIHLKAKSNHVRQGGQNLDCNSWMPEMQEGWTGSIVCTLDIKTRFEICKDENGELRKFVRNKSLRWNDHLTETELFDDSLLMEAIYLSRGWRSILHCSKWISGRRKGT